MSSVSPDFDEHFSGSSGPAARHRDSPTCRRHFRLPNVGHELDHVSELCSLHLEPPLNDWVFIIPTRCWRQQISSRESPWAARAI